MWVGFITMRVTELWMPPRFCVTSLPGTFAVRSAAWYMKAAPRGMRWETTARATRAPLRLNASIQSLSSIPAAAASFSLIHTIGPPRASVSMMRFSV